MPGSAEAPTSRPPTAAPSPATRTFVVGGGGADAALSRPFKIGFPEADLKELNRRIFTILVMRLIS
jgi:hypothetical protein